MKKQLRNMMLAGAATLLAGNAWAQEAGSVDQIADGYGLKIEWEQPTPWGPSQGRYATALKGANEILVLDNTAMEVYAFTKDGNSKKLNYGKAGVGISSDEAGNLIFADGWSGTAKGINVIPAEGGEIVNIPLTAPEGMELARIDQIGRVLGNVLSSDGGWLTIAYNTQNAIASYKIADGELIDSYASLTTPLTLSTMCIAQPWGTTMEECENASDPSMAVYLQGANVNKIYGPNADFDDWEGYARQNHGSAFGFDWFMLGDETYFVYGGRRADRTGSAWNCGDFFVVRASDNAVVAAYKATKELASGQSFGSIVAYANEDGKSATIYRWNSASGAAQLTFTVGGGETPVEPLYAVGAWCGWDPSSPDEFVYADGKYTITLGNKDDESTWVGEFKMSTTKGETASDWAGFEAGVICVADDQKIEENGKEYTLAVGGNANIAFGWPSQWTVTVDLVANTISAVAATEKPVVNEGDPLYITGANGQFDAVNPAEFTYDAAKKVYTYELVDPKYGFKISTAKGGWDAFNAAGFHINGTLAANTVTELLEGSPASGNINLAVPGDYTIVVDLANMTIEARGSVEVNAPETFFVIGQLVAGAWDPSVGGELTKNGNVFEGDVAMAGGYFSFTEKLAAASGDWAGLGQRYGAASDGYELNANVAAPFQKGENAFNIQSFTEYPVNVHFVVDFENMTVTISQATGVEEIAADAAAPAEYYNLQGLRVAQPEAGQLYIVKRGDKVSKVLVK